MRLIDSIHALVFASESPVAPSAIAQALGVPVYEVEENLETLGRRLSMDGPLQLVKIAGGYQLATKPEFAGAVARLIQPQPLKLTRSLLEVLAIIAYQQPATAAEIEAVRGVQSDYSLKQLVERKLVMEVGRKHAPGRPLLYGTTAQFLHMFNLNSLDELPDLSLVKGDIMAIGASTTPDQHTLFDEGLN